jgi:hypothetical protein
VKALFCGTGQVGLRFHAERVALGENPEWNKKRKEPLMRIITSSLLALGIASAISFGATGQTREQGFYFQGPGIEFGVGRPAYRERYYRYYDYDRPYVYSERPNSYYYYSRPERRYHRRGWDWN